jgi:transketolase
MIQNYQDLIQDITTKDERYVVMTAENRAIVRHLPEILKDRFIDVGITEQNMIGMAAGLALRGRIPIAHALSTFLTFRAYEFIRTDVGIAHLPVKLSSWIPGFLSDGNGPTHQALEDIALMRGIPGMQVFAPASHEDMLAMLPKIWASPHPSYVRITTRPAVVKHKSEFEIGQAEVIAEGTDITLLVYGFLLEETMKAKAILETNGLSVGVVNMRSLKPVDEKLILSLVKNTQRMVTIEDHFLTGGLYSIIAEILLKNKVTANVLPLAMEEKWFKPGLLSEVLEHEGFTGEKIAEKILSNQ